MRVDRLIKVLAEVTLIEMMVTIGLGVTFSDVSRVSRDYRRVARAVLANYILALRRHLAYFCCFMLAPWSLSDFSSLWFAQERPMARLLPRWPRETYRFRWD